jgi:hypothetical protein
MTRLEALEAVAEAVRDYWLKSASHENFYAVGQALRALDALPAATTQAQGEVVEAFFWRHPKWPPRVTFSRDTQFSEPGYVLVGSLPIHATVATEGGGE